MDKKILDDKDIDYLYRYYLKKRWMSQAQRAIGEREKITAAKCYICDERFVRSDKKVIDHNHFSGQYLGIAHDNCNCQRKTKAEMVVYFHNANYDFIQLLPKFFKKYGVEVIPDAILKAGERFMTLSLGLKLAKEVCETKSGVKKKIEDFIFTIRFIDSFSFLGASLAEVMETFPEGKLINLKKEFPKKEDFDEVRQKLPFSYGIMKDETKLSLPLSKRCECFDQLTGELMDEETYGRLGRIYNHFKCKTMGQLLKIYQKVDCTLLSDAVRTKRETTIADSKLDPANYL